MGTTSSLDLSQLLAENRLLRDDLADARMVRDRLLLDRYRMIGEVGAIEQRSRARLEAALEKRSPRLTRQPGRS